VPAHCGGTVNYLLCIEHCDDSPIIWFFADDPLVVTFDMTGSITYNFIVNPDGMPTVGSNIVMNFPPDGDGDGGPDEEPPPTPVPEPSSLVLLGSALLAARSGFKRG
jgi:hypothetical protein